VRERRLGRERIGRVYLYVSADSDRAAKQIQSRRALMAAAEEMRVALPTEVVIAVLVEALQASEGLASEAVVAARLTARGQDVTAEQVERIYAEFDLVPGKKTVAPL